MMAVSFSDLISVTKAIVGFIQGGVRIHVYSLLRGDPERGHEVTVFNASSRNITVIDFDIIRYKRRLFSKEVRSVYHSEDNLSMFEIPAGGKVSIEFRDQDHFAWGRDHDEKYGILYFVVKVAGSRRTFWFPMR